MVSDPGGRECEYFQVRKADLLVDGLTPDDKEKFANVTK
jgi:hypothetical protein